VATGRRGQPWPLARLMLKPLAVDGLSDRLWRTSASQLEIGQTASRRRRLPLVVLELVGALAAHALEVILRALGEVVSSSSTIAAEALRKRSGRRMQTGRIPPISGHAQCAQPHSGVKGPQVSVTRCRPGTLEIRAMSWRRVGVRVDTTRPLVGRCHAAVHHPRRVHGRLCGLPRRRHVEIVLPAPLAVWRCRGGW
jgi:hypothetical protein